MNASHSSGNNKMQKFIGIFETLLDEEESEECKQNNYIYLEDNGKTIKAQHYCNQVFFMTKDDLIKCVEVMAAVTSSKFVLCKW